MKKEYSFGVLTMVAMIISVMALSIAYASISQNLNINGVTTVKGNSWDIKFQNLQKPVIGGNAEIITPATLSYTTLNFDIYLKTPNDSVTYNWEIKNNGSIDAKLSSTPYLTGITSNLEKAITYSFLYDDGTEIKVNDTINSGEVKKIKLTISFKDSETVIPENTKLNLKTTLTYIQKAEQ